MGRWRLHAAHMTGDVCFAGARFFRGADPKTKEHSMAITVPTLSIRMRPAAALAAALAACQPSAPPQQEPAPDGGTAAATSGPADGLAPGERINFQCNEL